MSSTAEKHQTTMFEDIIELRESAENLIEGLQGLKSVWDHIGVCRNIVEKLLLWGKIASEVCDPAKVAVKACQEIVKGLKEQSENDIAVKRVFDNLLRFSELIVQVDSSDSRLLQIRVVEVIELISDGLSFIEKYRSNRSTIASGTLVIAGLSDTKQRIDALNNRLTTLSSDLHHVQQNEIHRKAQREDRVRELREVAEWLGEQSGLDFENVQKDLMKKKQEGTGTGFLQSCDFRTWELSSGFNRRSLLGLGIPGVGKTIHSANVVSHLRKSSYAGSKTPVMGMHFNYKERPSPKEVLIAFLHQLVLFEEDSRVLSVMKAFRQRHSVSTPELSDIREQLRIVLGLYPRAYIVVDALDEYNLESCSELLSELNGLLAVLNQLCVMATSRGYPEITNLLSDWHKVEISVDPADIRIYVSKRVDHLPRLRRLLRTANKSLDDVINAVTARANGRFLLVVLHLNYLDKQTTCTGLRNALADLPMEVDESYDKTLAHIKAGKDGEIALKTIQLVAFAFRPLHADELRHAVAIAMEPKRNLDEDSLTKIEDLVSSCAGLVVQDKESNVVRLIHETAHAYFHKDVICMEYFPTAHRGLAYTCINYFLMDTFSDGPFVKEDGRSISQRLTQKPKTFPFVRYAAVHWAEHFRRGKAEARRGIVAQFLQAKPNMRYAVELALRLNGKFFDLSSEIAWPDLEFTGLHLAACLDLRSVADIFQSEDVNIADGEGRTPLAWAAQCNSRDMVSWILERPNVDVNKPDNKGTTALLYAAYRGHTEVVKRLLDRDDTEEDRPNNRGESAIILAAQRGHLDVVRELLRREGVLADKQDNEGWTALMSAAEGGHLDVVRALLRQQGMLADRQNDKGWTALTCAVRRGHLEVVQELLGRGDVVADRRVNVEESAKRCDLPTLAHGKRAVDLAAERGEWDIVAVLLRLDGPGARSENIKRREIVKAYCEQEGRDAKTHIQYRQAVLQGGCRRPQWDVVLMVLEWEDVDASGDCEGEVPLVEAAFDGQLDVVEALLKRKEVDVNARNSWGWTALMTAANRGNLDIARVLLENGADADARNKYGYSPLWWAVLGEGPDVIRLLLDRDEVDPNPVDDTGRSLLNVAEERERDYPSESRTEILHVLREKCTPDAEQTPADALSGSQPCRGVANVAQ